MKKSSIVKNELKILLSFILMMIIICIVGCSSTTSVNTVDVIEETSEEIVDTMTNESETIVNTTVNESEIKDFELHTKGRYANFISDVKKKYELRNGKGLDYEYANVIFEDVINREELKETRNDIPMATYFVSIKPKHTNNILTYQCDILKSEFTREVEKYLENQDPTFIQDVISAADAINKTREKAESNQTEINVEYEGIKVGVNTDIGKIADYVGDTGVVVAVATQEALTKLFKDNKYETEKFIANLDELTYYAIMLVAMKNFQSNVTGPLSEEVVLRQFDDMGKKQYQKLKIDFRCEDSDNGQSKEKINLYEEKLKELNISKNVKNGFNSANVDNKGIGYTTYKIPKYYVDDKYNNYLEDEKCYSNNEDNNVVLNVYRIDDFIVGKNVVELREAFNNGDMNENIAGMIQTKFNENNVNVYDAENINVDGIDMYKFYAITDDNYYEVLEYLDVDPEHQINTKNVIIFFKEPINSTIEYKEDFSKIILSIKKVENVKLGKKLEDIKKDGYIKAYDLLVEKGFFNIECIPEKEGFPPFAGGNDVIKELTIDGNKKYEADKDVSQDAKIKIIYYNTKKYEEEKLKAKNDAEYKLLKEKEEESRLLEEQYNIVEDEVEESIYDESIEEDTYVVTPADGAQYIKPFDIKWEKNGDSYNLYLSNVNEKFSENYNINENDKLISLNENMGEKYIITDQIAEFLNVYSEEIQQAQVEENLTMDYLIDEIVGEIKYNIYYDSDNSFSFNDQLYSFTVLNSNNETIEILMDDLKEKMKVSNK